MQLLSEIYRHTGVDIQGRTSHRTAVRAVILRGTDLLMIFSSVVGDYKFPGGGVDEGESHEQALRREVQEECGMSLAEMGSGVGAVIEYDNPSEEEYDVFKMTSHYYRCEVKDGFGAQMLDDYERDLGFKPVWISIEDAIQSNKSLLHTEQKPEWLEREIFLLEYLQRQLLNESRFS